MQEAVCSPKRTALQPEPPPAVAAVAIRGHQRLTLVANSPLGRKYRTTITSSRMLARAIEPLKLYSNQDCIWPMMNADGHRADQALDATEHHHDEGVDDVC